MAGAAFLLTLALTWVLFHLYDTGSYFFVAVFSLNFLLLLGVAAVVIRNGLKLVLERRKGILGSRLRTRLTLAFVFLTLAPCALMFLITTKFVQLSVDFWFKEQITTSMEAALEVGQADYERASNRLAVLGRHVIEQGKSANVPRSGEGTAALIQNKKEEASLSLLGLLSSAQEEEIWQAAPESAAAWGAARASLNWEALREQGFQAVLATGLHEEHIVAVLALDKGRQGYLVLAESMGAGYRAKLDRVAKGAAEYNQLWRLKRSIKWMLYVGLGVLTLLIILGAVWFGIRVAKEITAPMLQLSDAVQRIARGDLSVRLEEQSNDEAGTLIRSFNRMAADLELSRSHITGINSQLAEQNREIAQHNQYMETVLNTIDSGVLSADEEGRLTMVNHAAAAMLMGSPQRLTGKFLSQILPQDRFAEDLLEQFRRRPRSHRQRQITLKNKEQERRVMINAVGLVTPEGRGFVAVLEDLSEMERVQRMEAWREVARRIAHEIKNPLTPIKLSAQRLQRKFGDSINDPAFSQSTALIVSQAQALLEMVQEFSLFAKLPEVNPTQDDLLPLLKELVEFFRNSHSKITWILETPDTLPLIPLDKEALRRAFMNLFANAADAVAATDTPRVRITVALEEERRLVRIDVADNGAGLTDEERARLFEPYFSRKKGGTGLGLTIVKSIIADHKGYTRAGLCNDGGAMLTVELPLG